MENLDMNTVKEMSLSALRELVQSLHIEIDEHKPSRSCLIRKIEAHINSNNQDHVGDQVEDDLANDEEMGDLGEQLKFKLAMRKMEIDQENRRMEIQIDQENRRMEIESKERIELARIAGGNNNHNNRREDSTSDLVRFKQLMPIFDEESVDDFFQLLDRTALDYNFPRDKMAVLLRSVLTKGKALDVVLSLTPEEDQDYELIKERVLQSYAYIPEKYRKMFRNNKKSANQTYVDFLRSSEKCLEQWLRSNHVDQEYDKLKNLILFEQFNESVTPEIRMHIVDRGVTDVHEASVLSDNFAINHNSVRSHLQEKPQYTHFKIHDNNVNKVPVFTNDRNINKVPAFTNDRTNANNKNPSYFRNNDMPKTRVACYYCKKEGHIKKDCVLFNKKPYPRQGAMLNFARVSRKSRFAVSKADFGRSDKHKVNHLFVEDVYSKTGTILRPTRRDSMYEDMKRPAQRNQLATEVRPEGLRPRSITQLETVVYENKRLSSNESATDEIFTDKMINENSEEDEIDCFNPFITEGLVSTGDDRHDQKSIKILRDTGSAFSILSKDTLQLNDATCTGEYIELRSLGAESIKAPLHRINLKSELFTGTITVGVWHTLPVKGISLILGNDVMGSKVTASPMEKQVRKESVDKMILQIENPVSISPTCALTRSMQKDGVPSDELLCMNTRNCLPRGRKSKKTANQAHLHEVNLSETFFAELDKKAEVKCDDKLSPKQKLATEQKNDEVLAAIRRKAVDINEEKSLAECYYIKDDILMKKTKPNRNGTDEDMEVFHQIMVPQCYRQDILHLAHDIPFAGHMGIHKTHHRILPYFYWPGLRRDVVLHCNSCHVCQMVGKPNQNIPVAPLKPIPAFDQPFSHVIIDCVGPLPKTKAGHQFLLTMMCSSTRFPEAIPLRSITSEKVVDALIGFFTRYGLPKTIQSDQGSNFTSNLFKQAMKNLGINHRQSSAYHPQSQGALERFHQTLKSALKKYCHENETDWDKGIPFVLFAVREAKQETLGFSPFELIYGHTVRGPLKLLHETWVSNSEPDELLTYVDSFKNRMFHAFNVVKRLFPQVQSRMKQRYDLKSKVRSFEPGDQVLILLPMTGEPLGTKYVGPYTIESKMNDVDYVVQTPDRGRHTRVCHINMLKPYISREETVPRDIPSTASINSVTKALIDTPTTNTDFVDNKLKNTAALNNLESRLEHLPIEQRKKLHKLIFEYSSLFSDVPRRTHLIEHDIEITEDARPIRQHPYRANPRQLEHLRTEVDYMLKNGIIEKGNGNWASPCVLVPKSDQTLRFCVDYRKVNNITKADSYPIPRIDDLIDRIGDASFITKIDLLSAYFQIPLTPRAQEISSFVTPDGLYKFKVMPFGLMNAPASFQRLINTITQDIFQCHAYLDDIVIYSADFDTHIKQLRELFDKLENASLTVNLAKSEFGCADIEYLGHVVGGGKVKPVNAKVEAILKVPIPQTRKQIRSFLGMAGDYRKFCKNFSTIACPLTDLLKKNNRFDWTPSCQAAFVELKNRLIQTPVLVTPHFDRPFRIAVDACDTGMGAVLTQLDDRGEEHPICYHSHKYNKHERNYSTIEKELLGIIYALKQFDFYVNGNGHTIEILTDHNPLTFLSRVRQNQRLVRWSLLLQSYNLKISHIKGKENLIADALSRL